VTTVYPHRCATRGEYHGAPCGCQTDLSCVLCARALGLEVDYRPAVACEDLQPGFCASAANGRERCTKGTCYNLDDDA
jgi:hypothetical protein